MQFSSVTQLPAALAQPLVSRSIVFYPTILAERLLELAGSELEGRELGISFLVASAIHGPSLSEYGTPIDLVDRVPSLALDARLHESGDRIDTLRNLRIVLGRQNDSAELIAIVDKSGVTKHLLLAADHATPQLISRLGPLFVLRPKEAIWLFDGGQIIYQALRLRDSTGWVVRSRAEEAAQFMKEYGGALESHDDHVTILETIWRASEQGVGAALVILEPNVPARESPGEPQKRRLIAQSLGLRTPMPVSSVAGLLRMTTFDGATLIQALGSRRRAHVLDAGVYFKAPGGRHSSARYLTQKAPWVRGAIVVSQDGAITWYSRGAAGYSGGDLVRYQVRAH